MLVLIDFGDDDDDDLEQQMRSEFNTIVLLKK
jgi:hypothetical protein